MPRHHTVPQMYLKQFADPKNKVRLVDRDSPSRTFRTNTKNACAQVGFYDWETGLAPEQVTDPSDIHPERIEQLLSAFESRATAPLQAMARTGHPPTQTEDRYHLGWFVALQASRGIRFREDLDQIATFQMREQLRQRWTPDVVREHLVESGMPSGPRDVADFVEEALGANAPRLVTHQAVAIQQALRMAYIGARQLWARPWTVVQFMEPSLLTGDEPVLCWHPAGEPVSIANAPIIWMPLGRRHALEIRNEPGSDQTRAGTPEEAQLMNSAVASQAERWIVAHPDDIAIVNILDLSPRTAWTEEILSTSIEPDGIRVVGRVRRRPIQ